MFLPGIVRECRHMNVTPHVAQNYSRSGSSAIDERTARHASYRISQRKRKRIEECFGWLKTVALLRKPFEPKATSWLSKR